MGALEALVGIFREADSYQALERGRGERLQRGDGRGFGGQYGGDDAGSGLAVKSFFARGHFVEHGAERENIGAGVGFFAFELFGGHVLECADDAALLGERLGGAGGEF